MSNLSEADVEQATLDWLAGLGWAVAHGPEIAPDTPHAERGDYGQVVLERRLRDALAELNPRLPHDALDDAYRKLTRPDGTTLEARNRDFPPDARGRRNDRSIREDDGGRARGDHCRALLTSITPLQ